MWGGNKHLTYDNSAVNVEVKEDIKASMETKNSLRQVKNELSGATASLTAKEKEVIQIIMSTIESVSVNPSYNYAADVKQVMNIYKKLTLDERNRLKTSIYSNLDMDTAVRLKNTFGL